MSTKKTRLLARVVQRSRAEFDHRGDVYAVSSTLVDFVRPRFARLFTSYSPIIPCVCLIRKSSLLVVSRHLILISSWICIILLGDKSLLLLPICKRFIITTILRDNKLFTFFKIKFYKMNKFQLNIIITQI